MNNETALLSTLLTYEEGFDEVTIQPEMFLDARHERIFGAMLDLRDANQPVNIVSVAAKLPSESDYIWGLTSEIYPSVSLAFFADQIRDDYIKRQLLSVASDIMNAAGAEPQALIDRIRTKLDSVVSKEPEAKSLLQHYDDLMANLDKPPAMVDCGMRNLSKVIGGYRDGAMYVVAARPGVGKSLFALDAAYKIAETAPVLFFSLEMESRDLMGRLVASLASVPATDISYSTVHEDDRKRLEKVRDKLNRNLVLRVMPGINVNQVRAEFRRASRQTPIKAIVIDYLGLMSDTSRTSNRYEKVTNISNALKRLALELDVPIIALHQLNREVEGRSDPRPTLSDLRDSGAIEQDADAVFLLYREQINGIYDNRMQVLIAKNRHGSQGKISFDIHPAYTRIVESSHE